MTAATVLIRDIRKSNRQSNALSQAVSSPSHVYLIDENLSILKCDSAGKTLHVRLSESDAVIPRDLCVSPGGILHVLADDGNASSVFRLVGSDPASWEKMPFRSRLVRLACGPDGVLWAVDHTGGLRSFHFGDEANAIQVEGPDFAQEVSVGGDGRVWVVSTEERYAGRVVRWRAKGQHTWTSLPAPSSAIKLAADPDGVAWTVNTMGAIWRLHPLGSGNFSECQVDTDCDRCIFGTRREFARDISVDHAGTVWALSVNQVEGGFQLMRLADKMTKRFEALGSGAIRIAGA
jgi:Tectonin domain